MRGIEFITIIFCVCQFNEFITMCMYVMKESIFYVTFLFLSDVVQPDGLPWHHQRSPGPDRERDGARPLASDTGRAAEGSEADHPAWGEGEG